MWKEKTGYHLNRNGMPITLTVCSGAGKKDKEYYKYKRINIALNGLNREDYGTQGVWGNNQIENIFNLYPINIDGLSMSDNEILEWVHSFDV